MSVDSVESQCAFATKLDLPFKLLADPKLEAISAFGVKKTYGMRVLAARSTFIIDKSGKIAWEDTNFGVPKKLAGTGVLTALDGLVKRQIGEAVKNAKGKSKAEKKLFLEGVQAVCTKDEKALAALAASDVPKKAPKKCIAGIELPDPRPSVFDLVKVSAISIIDHGSGMYEATAATGMKSPASIHMTMKKTPDGFRIESISATKEEGK